MIQELAALTSDGTFKNFWCHLCKMDIYQRNSSRLENEQQYCLMCESPLEIIQSSEQSSTLREFEIYVSPEAINQDVISRSLQLIINLEEMSNIMGLLNFLTSSIFSEEENQGASEQQIDSLHQRTVTKDEDQKTCNICYEDFKEGEIQTEMTCDHHFHKDCLTTWLKINNSCPTCRAKIV